MVAGSVEAQPRSVHIEAPKRDRPCTFSPPLTHRAHRSDTSAAGHMRACLWCACLCRPQACGHVLHACLTRCTGMCITRFMPATSCASHTMCITRCILLALGCPEPPAEDPHPHMMQPAIPSYDATRRFKCGASARAPHALHTFIRRYSVTRICSSNVRRSLVSSLG